MKDKFKELTVKLSNHLYIEIFTFLDKNLDEEENLSEVIDLILSSSISALFNAMNKMSNDYPEHKNQVSKFTDDLRKYISTREPIESMELIEEDIHRELIIKDGKVTGLQ